MAKKSINKNVLAWLLFVILALIWGSSFKLMKLGLHSFSYSQIGMIRISLAFLFTVIIGFKYFKFLTKKNWFPLFIVGIFGNGLPYVLFPLAVSKIDSSLVGILNSLVPMFTLIIGLIWFRLRIKWVGILGICLGLVGAIWLLMPGLKIDPNTLIYGSYPILATICYAISINTINSKLKDLGSMQITLLSLLFCGVPAILYVLSTDFLYIMANDEMAWESFSYVLILGVVGSSLAIILFNHMIKTSGSIFAASVTYAIPIVALLWGLYDKEDIGIQHGLGMISILIGVYLVNKRGSIGDRIKAQEEEKL